MQKVNPNEQDLVLLGRKTKATQPTVFSSELIKYPEKSLSDLSTRKQFFQSVIRVGKTEIPKKKVKEMTKNEILSNADLQDYVELNKSTDSFANIMIRYATEKAKAKAFGTKKVGKLREYVEGLKDISEDEKYVVLSQLDAKVRSQNLAKLKQLSPKEMLPIVIPLSGTFSFFSTDPLFLKYMAIISAASVSSRVYDPKFDLTVRRASIINTKGLVEDKEEGILTYMNVTPSSPLAFSDVRTAEFHAIAPLEEFNTAEVTAADYNRNRFCFSRGCTTLFRVVCFFSHKGIRMVAIDIDPVFMILPFDTLQSVIGLDIQIAAIGESKEIAINSKLLAFYGKQLETKVSYPFPYDKKTSTVATLAGSTDAMYTKVILHEFGADDGSKSILHLKLKANELLENTFFMEKSMASRITWTGFITANVDPSLWIDYTETSFANLTSCCSPKFSQLTDFPLYVYTLANKPGDKAFDSVKDNLLPLSSIIVCRPEINFLNSLFLKLKNFTRKIVTIRSAVISNKQLRSLYDDARQLKAMAKLMADGLLPISSITAISKSLSFYQLNNLVTFVNINWRTLFNVLSAFFYALDADSNARDDAASFFISICDIFNIVPYIGPVSDLSKQLDNLYKLASLGSKKMEENVKTEGALIGNIKAILSDFDTRISELDEKAITLASEEEQIDAMRSQMHLEEYNTKKNANATLMKDVLLSIALLKKDKSTLEKITGNLTKDEWTSVLDKLSFLGKRIASTISDFTVEQMVVENEPYKISLEEEPTEETSETTPQTRVKTVSYIRKMKKEGKPTDIFKRELRSQTKGGKK